MFTCQLVIKRPAGSKNRYELAAPLVWQDALGVIIVPAGFIYDGASAPRVLSYIVPRFGGRYDRAIALHDYLYAQGRISRANSDKIFYEALRSDKVSWVQAKIMYFAVRFFGKKHYKG
ncbi:MAG: DUF1353 domain-containing protein [Campylobacter sp.]|nr:DUF1353 domain-containing protein [Campylobacter sp.]